LASATTTTTDTTANSADVSKMKLKEVIKNFWVHFLLKIFSIDAKPT